MESKVLECNGESIKIVELRSQCLLLKESIVSTEAYSINIFNLNEPVPIRVTSSADRNTYAVIDSNNDICSIYTGCLGCSNNDNNLSYK
jgi:hypothetical protein